MITINYQGNNAAVAAAAQRANELLLDQTFFNRIAALPAFDYSTASPQQVADILEHSIFIMNIEFYRPRNPFSKANAYDDPQHPLVIHLNERKLNRSLASICATLIHEAVHAADALQTGFSFGHNGNSAAGNENTAPYQIDGLAYEMVSGQASKMVFQHDSMSSDQVA